MGWRPGIEGWAEMFAEVVLLWVTGVAMDGAAEKDVEVVAILTGAKPAVAGLATGFLLEAAAGANRNAADQAACPVPDADAEDTDGAFPACSSCLLTPVVRSHV